MHTEHSIYLLSLKKKWKKWEMCLETVFIKLPNRLFENLLFRMSRFTKLQHEIYTVTENVLCEEQFGASLDVVAFFFFYNKVNMFYEVWKPQELK